MGRIKIETYLYICDKCGAMTKRKSGPDLPEGWVKVFNHHSWLAFNESYDRYYCSEECKPSRLKDKMIKKLEKSMTEEDEKELEERLERVENVKRANRTKDKK